MITHLLHNPDRLVWPVEATPGEDSDWLHPDRFDDPPHKEGAIIEKGCIKWQLGPVTIERTVKVMGGMNREALEVLLIVVSGGYNGETPEWLYVSAVDRVSLAVDTTITPSDVWTDKDFARAHKGIANGGS